MINNDKKVRDALVTDKWPEIDDRWSIAETMVVKAV